MSREQDFFEQALHKALNEAEITPSPHHWERIEGSLTYAPPITPLRRIVRWGSVAAASVALALATTFWLSGDEVVAPSQFTASRISHFQKIDGLAINAAPTFGAQAKFHAAATSNNVEPEQKLSNSVEEGMKMAAEATEAEDQNKQQSSPSAEPDTFSQPYVPTHYHADTEPHYSARHNTPSKFTMALVAGGGATTSRLHEVSGVSPTSLSDAPDGVVRMCSYQSHNPAEVHHHAPLSFGVAVGYPLSKRWSLESGLNYTQLTSDLTMSYSSGSIRQRAEFVGLPLGIKYRAYDLGQLSLYVGSGVQLERCISAVLGGKKLDERPWHTSLRAAAALQYNINDWLGFYAEPAASYYLTPSNINTIRSESTVNFNMSFGLRFVF